MRIHRLVVGLLASVLLAGCGLAPDLSKVQLEPLLIQTGDLPTGITTGQVMSLESAEITPVPVQAIKQNLAHGNDPAGFVTVLLYNKTQDSTQFYTATTERTKDGTTPYDGLGEQATLLQKNSMVLDTPVATKAFTWRRCGAVAIVGLLDNDYSVEELATYAKRLDKRLQEAVCP